jgi:hypothetical protein
MFERQRFRRSEPQLQGSRPACLEFGPKPHVQRRRSLRGWETAHKTAEIQSTANGAILSCYSFGAAPTGGLT